MITYAHCILEKQASVARNWFMAMFENNFRVYLSGKSVAPFCWKMNQSKQKPSWNSSSQFSRLQFLISNQINIEMGRCVFKPALDPLFEQQNVFKASRSTLKLILLDKTFFLYMLGWFNRKSFLMLLQL